MLKYKQLFIKWFNKINAIFLELNIYKSLLR